MRASEMMTGAPKSCRPDDPVDRALEHMDECECGAVPVVDEEQKVVGIVTDRDILFGVRGNDGRTEGLTVSECMTGHPVTVQQDAAAEKVVRQMREARVRRVPVVDAEGGLVGIVAQADLAVHLGDDALLAGYLREVSAAPPVEPAPER